MTVLATPADISEIQSLYPYLNIKPLTRQMEQAMLLYMRGLSVAAASKGAGYKDSRVLKQFLDSEEGHVILEHLQRKQFNEIRVTREMLTNMLFEAHSKAATATEEIAAIRELGKMHDLYENEKRKGAVNVNINSDAKIINSKQIERMSDEQLLELAGPELKGILIEGEVVQEPPITDDPDYDEALDI